MNIFRQLVRAFACVVMLFSFLGAGSAQAVDKGALNADARAALQSLYQKDPAAKALSDKAAAILVFPEIVRAGFVVGGSIGDGVMYRKDKAVGYYSSGSASVGMQAGMQSFGYALFFMSESDVKNFQKVRGWDVGAAPTLVVVDSGVAKQLNTTTIRKGVYAFIFNQEGLMAGVALQGQKITPIK